MFKIGKKPKIDELTLETLADGVVCTEIEDVESFKRLYFSMFKKKDRKDLLCKIGETCIKEHTLDVAEEAFKQAGHKPGLSSLGHLYLSSGELGSAERVFLLAKDTKGLEEVGDVYLERYEEHCERENLPLAQHAYKLAQSIPGLIKVGRKSLEAGEALGPIEKLFISISYTEGLKEIGDAYLENSEFGEAERLYRLSGYTDGLKELAQANIEEEDFEEAMRFAKEGMFVEELEIIADRLMERGSVEQAVETYQLAGAMPSKSEFADYGYKLIVQGADFAAAEEAYRLSDTPEIADFLKQFVHPEWETA